MKAEILIVDDEESIRFTFKSFLSDEGYSVETAKSFDEALEKLSMGNFSLIFTDIIMRGLTGIDLLREVKRRKIDTPVIMITGAPDMNSVSEALRLGAFDYIAKPINEEMLVRITKVALQHSEVIREKNQYRSNLEAIFRSMRDGVISADNNLVVNEVNDGMKEICGFSRAEVVGKHFDSLELGCGKKCFVTIAETVKNQSPVEMNRIECCHENRPVQFVTLATSPLIDHQGNYSGAVMVVRDETRLNQLEKDLNERQQYFKVIGKSEKMQQIYSLIESLANVKTTVLITGESGTGKELIAEAIHFQGDRNDKPLIKVNCSALSENLLESELFGSVKGAYTGAIKDKVGRFEKADGGTLFLDEIGDISPKIQLQLLRFLQEKTIERVGDSTPIKLDVRVVAATNQNMREKVAKGEVREDLFYRLKVVELSLPPLRERAVDIALLEKHFVAKFNKEFNKNITGFSAPVLELFRHYNWPGNIREMEHVVEHAFVICHDKTIDVEHLPPDFLSQEASSSPIKMTGQDERQQILDAIEKASGNKAKAARLLGISRRTMYRKIDKLNISTI